MIACLYWLSTTTKTTAATIDWLSSTDWVDCDEYDGLNVFENSLRYVQFDMPPTCDWSIMIAVIIVIIIVWLSLRIGQTVQNVDYCFKWFNFLHSFIHPLD